MSIRIGLLRSQNDGQPIPQPRSSLFLAAADGNDNFQPVTAAQGSRCMLAFRDDFTIALDGDPLAGVTQQVDQTGDGQGIGKLAADAIEGEF
jgi:hypothetical protein